MTIRFIEPNRADPRLAIERKYTMTIGGKSVGAASGKTIKRESSVHPGLIVGEFPEASAEDVAGAIAAARKAFDDGPWPRMSGKERAAYLFKISQAIRDNAEELALIESLEVGKTLAGARGEMANCADLWHFAAGLVRGLEGSTHNALNEHDANSSDSSLRRIEAITPRLKTLGADVGEISFFVFGDELFGRLRTYFDTLKKENKSKAIGQLEG